MRLGDVLDGGVGGYFVATAATVRWASVTRTSAFAWSLVVAADGVGGDVGFGGGGGNAESLAVVGAGIL